MVELFTVGCLIRSPRLSAPVWSVARLTAPHVSTVERTRHDSKPMSPRDGIWQSIATPASFRTAQSPRRRDRHQTTEHVRLARIQNVKNKSRLASSRCNRCLQAFWLERVAGFVRIRTTANACISEFSRTLLQEFGAQSEFVTLYRIERWDSSDT